MKLVNRAYGIFIIVILLSSNLISESINLNNFGKIRTKAMNAKRAILSPRDILMKVQDDPGRLHQEVEQTWSTENSQYENDIRYSYTYGGDHDKLTRFFAESWQNGSWENYYDFTYFYRAADGFVEQYNSYDWTGTGWDFLGFGEFSNYDQYGNYYQEIYYEWAGATAEKSQKWEYNYDIDGNMTDMYNYDWTNSAWEPYDWNHNNYQDGYLNSSIYYVWDGSTYVEDGKSDFAYANGYADPILYAGWWMFDGSPSTWTMSNWDGAAWVPQLQNRYDINNCGWPTGATQYNNYDPGSMTWSEGDFRNKFTFNNTCGVQKQSVDILDADTRLTVFESEIKDNGQWIAYNKTWISYENLLLDTQEDNSIPNNFTLEQNYPNPFNPNTNITFSLSEETDVQLLVYDLTGKLINELVNTQMQIGNHSITWDSTDNNGVKVGAGVYIYKLQTDNFSQSRKMILLK